MRIRTTTLAVAAAVLALLMVGCGDSSCNDQTPPVSEAGVPSCPTMAPNQLVQVQLGVCPECDQGTPRCEVRFDNLAEGDIQLEPLSEVCESATCPIVDPRSCAAAPVTCAFTTPGPGDYELVVIDSQGAFRSEPFIVGAGGNTICTL